MEVVMAFRRERVIGNNVYIYIEHRWRGSDGKVKSKSEYVGKVGGTAPKKRNWLGVDWGATLKSEPGAASADAAFEEQQREAQQLLYDRRMAEWEQQAKEQEAKEKAATEVTAQVQGGTETTPAEDGQSSSAEDASET